MKTQYRPPACSFFLVCLLLAATATSAQTLLVVQPDSQTTSKRLSDLHNGNPDLVRGPTDIKHLRTGSVNSGPAQPDGALQTNLGPLINATAGTHFDGMSVYEGGYIPSDNNIAVGPNHIVETVNAAVSVYTKGGTRLMGPTALRSMWTGLGGQCAANNGGDPVVQYDKAADRFMITQLGSLSSPYAECIAVSQTSDPTGAYFLYSYSFGTNLNDYPKFGVWSTATNSAYLATYNLFAGGGPFAGPEICAYDRQAMINGTSAAALCYTGIGGDSFLPSDVDGPTPPLNGTPGYFLAFNGSSSLMMYKLAPNFAASTATLTAMPNLPVTGFSESPSVPQPGTGMLLDSLSDRPMYRLAFRMFGDHEALVLAHSVVAGSSSGVRWYEIRGSVSTNPAFSVFQQGTFAPDADYRWMGSAAMDQAGDIAIGYSVSSGTTFPSVRYTGRMPGDAPGSMESEATIKAGAGSQTGYSRWGDYSSMRIDPSDDCTFWYVNEYLPLTSSYGWYTHIGSFKFSGCGGAPAPDFSLSASPSSISATQGGAGVDSTVTVTSLNSFNAVVSLIVSGCPSFATCSLSHASVTPPANGSDSTTKLTVTAGSSTPGGSYTVTVSGTGSSGIRSTSVTVNVPDYTLSASPSSLSIQQGQGKSSTITVSSLGGFAGSVPLSVSGCPANTTTCAVSPTSVTAPGSSVLTITTTSTTPTGSYPLTITGGDAAHFTTVSLTVTAQADFTISAPASILVSRKSSGKVTVSVTAVGASSSVTLSVSGAPSKVTTSFSPNPVTATGISTLTINVNPTAAKGTYTLKITGNNGPNSSSATLSLMIN